MLIKPALSQNEMPITSSSPQYDVLYKQIIKCALVKPLAAGQIDKLLSHSRIIKIQEGETIAEMGQAANEFFLCIKGELKLVVSSPQGQEKILDIVLPGQTFAEVLMFLDQPKYPASISAILESAVVAFPSKLYKNMLANSINACFSLLGEYALRNRSLVSEIEALALHNATYRVISYLLKVLLDDVDNGASLNLSTPKHIIASRISITPETLSRILAKLKNDKIIEVTDRHVTVLDINWMRAFIGKSTRN